MQQASLMSQMHGTSLPSTPQPFGPVYLLQVSKNDDKKTLLLGIIWFYSTAFDVYCL